MDRDRGLLLASVGALSDNELMQKLRATFDQLVIGEIRRALEARLGVASMILLACAIDLLGSLYEGSDATGKTFGSFVREFLTTYDASKLSDMRNRLVHNYVVPADSYAFSLGRERATEHLAPGDRPRLILELLADDVERGGAELFSRAENQPKLLATLLARARTPGLILAEPADVGSADASASGE